MFYEELKKRRESLGITLEQIANKTKVSLTILEAFENGDFSKLPNTYTRLFIKAYVQEIGEDPVGVIKAYEEFIGANKEPNIPKEKDTSFLSLKNDFIVPGTKKRNITAIITIIVIVIFLITILKQVLMEEEKKSQTTIPTTIGTLSPPVEDNNSSEVVLPETQIQEIVEEPSMQLLSLVMKTTDTCWVRMIIDEMDTTEANYLPNIRREWKAKDKFDVRVGRPSKIELYLNNKKLGPLGNAGIPTHFIITKNGLVRATLLRR
ncbi:MAG: helix-turn-helix domain-containing protein [Candidatus Marinimicrobia bacterium]|nr:helix-turn-helix domain-containing protein [Candidatus Neomarinimicrobiota bacterium]